MAFALGEAIAAEFRRIAELLRGPLFPPSGTGGGSPSSPSPLPSAPPPGGSGAPPGPPGTGVPPVPLEPPPVVTVPTVDLFPSITPSVADCPVFSPDDYGALLVMERQAREQGVALPAPSPLVSITGTDMPLLFNTDVPLESSDFFRFRAYGSAGVVTVSFFGRIAHRDGTIQPFNHPIKILNGSTVFQLTPQAGAGWLLGAAASVPIGSITTGAVFAVGEIGRLAGATFTPHTLLFSGQVSEQQPLSSTLASPTTPVSNPTFLLVQVAGGTTDFISTTITPTSGKRARVTGVAMDYVTSATAGNRQVYIRTLVGTIGITRSLANDYIGASTNGVLRGSLAGQNMMPTSNLPGSFREIPLPLPETLYFTGPFIVEGGAFGPSPSGDIASNLNIVYEET